MKLGVCGCLFTVRMPSEYYECDNKLLILRCDKAVSATKVYIS